MMFEVCRRVSPYLGMQRIAVVKPQPGDYFRSQLSGKSRGKISWPGRQNGDFVIVWDGDKKIGWFWVRGNQVPRAK